MINTQKIVTNNMKNHTTFGMCVAIFVVMWNGLLFFASLKKWFDEDTFGDDCCYVWRCDAFLYVIFPEFFFRIVKKLTRFFFIKYKIKNCFTDRETPPDTTNMFLSCRKFPVQHGSSSPSMTLQIQPPKYLRTSSLHDEETVHAEIFAHVCH